MKPFLKKITAVFFILAAFLPFILPFSLDIKQEFIRRQMKKKVAAVRQLHTVVVPEKEVVWMDDHEIWVNESMFDISSMKLENGLYTFTGLYDEEETRLVKQRNQHSQKGREENKTLSLLFLCFQQLIFDDAQAGNCLPAILQQKKTTFSEKEIKVAYPVLVPPPKSLLI